MLKGKRSNQCLALSAGLFFFLLFYHCFSLSLPTPSRPYYFYSTESRDDLKKILIAALKKASSSIQLSTYALTDPAILTLLKKKGEEGVQIDLYYHAKASPSLHLLKYKNLHFHPIDEKGLMHEKIWIIDEKQIFLGSANLTPSSLEMHQNCMVGLYCPPLGSLLTSGRVPEALFPIEEGVVGLFFSLPHPRALSHLLEALDTATSEVKVALFTFTHPLLVEKLITLHKRGIDVQVILDQTSARGASKNAFELLNSEGVEVSLSKGLELYHHKWCQIDDSTLIIGSANWTKAAFNKNKEFILFINK